MPRRSSWEQACSLAVFSLNSWSFVDVAALLPRFQPVGCVGVLAASLVSSVLSVKCVKFYFPIFTGSVKGKRSGKGGTVFRSVSEKCCPSSVSHALLDFVCSRIMCVLRVEEVSAFATGSRGAFVISSVLKRGCIVGLALDLFQETSLPNDWCVVLFLAAMLFAMKAAHMGLSGGLCVPELQLHPEASVCNVTAARCSCD